MTLLLRALGATAFTYGFVVVSPYAHTYRAARNAGVPRGVALSMWAEHLREAIRDLPKAINQ